MKPPRGALHPSFASAKLAALLSALFVVAVVFVVAACSGASSSSSSSSATALASVIAHSRVRSGDGVELFVAETGPRDAQAIVLIHGLGFSHEVWGAQWRGELAKRFHLVTYDLRGHGRSSRPTDPAAYRDGARWADDLHAVLAATRAKDPIVVGWSLGGLVIAHYLRVHGDAALGGMVLTNAVTKIAPEVFAEGNQRYLAGLSNPNDAARAQATAAFLAACFYRPLPEPELAALTRAAGVLPVWQHQAIQQLSLDGVEPALRALTKPARIIHGVHDVLVADAMATYSLSLLQHAVLSRYEGSGHAPFSDEAARFDAELASLAGLAIR